jgi:hypothetical protein
VASDAQCMQMEELTSPWPFLASLRSRRHVSCSAEMHTRPKSLGMRQRVARGDRASSRLWGSSVQASRRACRGLAWIRSASAAACLLVAGPAVSAQLTLDWTDNATNESGARIERRLSPSGTYSEIATVGPNVTTFADTTVTAGQFTPW